VPALEAVDPGDERPAGRGTHALMVTGSTRLGFTRAG